MKYYICEHCGNIIEYVKESGVPVMCCGQKMTEIVPGTSEGAHEKHIIFSGLLLKQQEVVRKLN